MPGQFHTQALACRLHVPDAPLDERETENTAKNIMAPPRTRHRQRIRHSGRFRESIRRGTATPGSGTMAAGPVAIEIEDAMEKTAGTCRLFLHPPKALFPIPAKAFCAKTATAVMMVRISSLRYLIVAYG
jgi:hypothetical protein